MANIQTVELREGMFDAVRSGEKKATLRNGRRDYIVGDTILYGNERKNVEFITVTDVVVTTLSKITDADAQQEGYLKRQDLIDVMESIYGKLTDDSVVTQVFFEYVKK